MKTETIDLRTDADLAQCLRLRRPVAVLAFDYAAGERVPAHQHTKAQLIYAVEGSMIVTTAEGHWALLPTRAIWVPAHTRHGIRMRGPAGAKVRMRTVFFDDSVPPPASRCAVIRVSPLLRELIVAQSQEPRLYRPQSRAAQIASLLVAELRIWQVLPLYLPQPREPRLRRVCHALQQNPSLHGSMDHWAAREGISSRTLARLFRAELGMSFDDWRSQLLLLEAQIRLAQGQSSQRIARALGYARPAAFSAMFRRATGHSPSGEKRSMHAQEAASRK
ncbi:AraC family transcriptional regulator [Silvibacterium sp.]|uniref:AraC family transcriptional regulator n=1 Tax=Silvibacterium sp. TaxID=1964179 RepID=UPI0039E5944C